MGGDSRTIHFFKVKGKKDGDWENVQYEGEVQDSSQSLLEEESKMTGFLRKIKEKGNCFTHC